MPIKKTWATEEKPYGYQRSRYQLEKARIEAFKIDYIHLISPSNLAKLPALDKAVLIIPA
ncbi:MAG: hypothetical protein LBS60_01410 [Deltaproteobacteria bacterium]|nr:hypothetical protein [Deltaproteobacteria bacterium]